MGRHRNYPMINSTGLLVSSGYIWHQSARKEGRAIECDCCSKPALHFIRWEFSYMRGDDELNHYCQRHYDMAHQQEKRMWAHMRGKEKWLKNNKPTGE